jgi:hypothetical protein
MTLHRALSLAIAALGDCARTLDTTNNTPFASEVREAADQLTALRDKQSPPSTPVPRETQNLQTQTP